MAYAQDSGGGSLRRRNEEQEAQPNPINTSSSSGGSSLLNNLRESVQNKVDDIKNSGAYQNLVDNINKIADANRAQQEEEEEDYSSPNDSGYTYFPYDTYSLAPQEEEEEEVQPVVQEPEPTVAPTPEPTVAPTPEPTVAPENPADTETTSNDTFRLNPPILSGNDALETAEAVQETEPVGNNIINPVQSTAQSASETRARFLNGVGSTSRISRSPLNYQAEIPAVDEAGSNSFTYPVSTIDQRIQEYLEGNGTIDTTRDTASAFRKNAGATNDETEFYSGNPLNIAPRTSGYDRAEEQAPNAPRTPAMLFPTDYGGTVIPDMPDYSFPEIEAPSVPMPTQEELANVNVLEAGVGDAILNGVNATGNFISNNYKNNPAGTLGNILAMAYGSPFEQVLPQYVPKLGRFVNNILNYEVGFDTPQDNNPELGSLQSFLDIGASVGLDGQELYDYAIDEYERANGTTPSQEEINGTHEPEPNVVTSPRTYVPEPRTSGYDRAEQQAPRGNPLVLDVAQPSEVFDNYTAANPLSGEFIPSTEDIMNNLPGAVRTETEGSTWAYINEIQNGDPRNVPPEQFATVYEAMTGDSAFVQELNDRYEYLKDFGLNDKQISMELYRMAAEHQNPLAEATDSEGNLHYNYVLAREGILPEDMSIPNVGADGSFNDAMNEIINSVNYLDSDGMALWRDDTGRLWQPYENPDGTIGQRIYTGDVQIDNKYKPDDILSLYVNPNGGHNGEPVWRGLDEMMNSLTPEQRAGMEELLANFVGGGDKNRLSQYDLEYANLTEAQYEMLANLFFERMPALRELAARGLLSNPDNPEADPYLNAANFFFKKLRGSNSGNNNSNGNSSSRRTYSGGGGGSYGGGYSRSYSSGSSGSTYSSSYPSTPRSTYSGVGSSSTPRSTTYTSPSSIGTNTSRRSSYPTTYYNNGNTNADNVTPQATTQKQSRIYNIMKNWSF